MPARKSLTESLSAGESLVCFVTAGDPALDQLPDIIDALNEGGADIIEIGIPFSDPIADGPTIQAASQRALDRRTTPRAIFDVLSAVESAAPLVAMGYANIAMRIGYAEFAESVSKAGISGVI